MLQNLKRGILKAAENGLPTEELSTQDREILKESLKLTLLPFVLIGVLALMALFFYFSKYPIKIVDLFKSENLHYFLSVAFVVIAYFVLLITIAGEPFLDLRYNQKHVQHEVLKEKKENVKYGFRSYRSISKTASPTLTEYYFEFDNLQVMVEKEVYDNFIVGDNVKLYSTMYTNKILTIEKANN